MLLGNPVLARETTERLRGLRAFVVISVFVVVLALTAFAVYETATVGSGASDLATRTRSGRLVFEVVLLVMTVLVLFVVPGLTAGAIAGERERQTLTTLQVTLLRPGDVIAGKVLAALAFLGLLVSAALPVLAIAYVLGGIRLLDIVKGVVAVVLVAVLLAAMVVAVSAFARRVQTATILAYTFAAALALGAPVLFGVASLLDATSGEEAADPDPVAAPAVLLVPNPIVLVADLAAGTSSTDDGPLSAISVGIADAKYANDDRWVALFPAAERAVAVGERPPVSGLPAWVLATASLAVLALGMCWAAARRLRTPAGSER